MSQVPVIIFLLIAATTPVFAAPWSRWKENVAGHRPSESHDWADEQEIGHYSFRSEFPLQDIDGLIQDLGELQVDIEKTLQLECQPQPIQFFFFHNKRSYESYIRSRIPEGVNRRALFVSGPNAGRIYAYRQLQLDIDVRHEATHAILRTALPIVPIWIDEGLAEYFEVSESLRRQRNPHHGELQSAISRHHWTPNIEKLESKRRLKEMGRDDYRDSWGIVHFLLNGPPEARESLQAYFEEIQSGDAPTSLNDRLRHRIPNLDQAIVDHLRH